MQTLNVVWHEGMLLRPQHFQQHDRYYDEQLTRRTSGLHAHAWGFTRLELDTLFLALGVRICLLGKPRVHQQPFAEERP